MVMVFASHDELMAYIRADSEWRMQTIARRVATRGSQKARRDELAKIKSDFGPEVAADIETRARSIYSELTAS